MANWKYARTAAEVAESWESVHVLPRLWTACGLPGPNGCLPPIRPPRGLQLLVLWIFWMNEMMGGSEEARSNQNLCACLGPACAATVGPSDPCPCRPASGTVVPSCPLPGPSWAPLPSLCWRANRTTWRRVLQPTTPTQLDMSAFPRLVSDGRGHPALSILFCPRSSGR
jgi:hypothetical protein